MPETVTPSKFCTACGKQLHIKAEICPSCGVRAMAAPGKGINKAALLLLTFFLGNIGAHKFYQKKYGLGFLYFLFFWTGIPCFIAFIEFIIYCFKSREELQELYPETSDVALVLVIVLPLAIIPTIGILAAIAIPQFAAYRAKAFNSVALSDLKNCKTVVEEYYADNRSYPTRTGQMSCESQDGVALYYLVMGSDDFQIITFHEKGEKAYLISTDSADIAQNSRQEIENQLADQLGLEAEYGSFHFVE